MALAFGVGAYAGAWGGEGNLGRLALAGFVLWHSPSALGLTLAGFVLWHSPLALGLALGEITYYICVSFNES